jgi:hypothetical protein
MQFVLIFGRNGSELKEEGERLRALGYKVGLRSSETFNPKQVEKCDMIHLLGSAPKILEAYAGTPLYVDGPIAQFIKETGANRVDGFVIYEESAPIPEEAMQALSSETQPTDVALGETIIPKRRGRPKKVQAEV